MLANKGVNLKEIGGWRLSKKLGSGGNGTVWLAQKGQQTGAMKVLRVESVMAKKRFHDEVESMRLCTGIAGVLPVFDAQVDPDAPGEKWFVMGLAKVLTKQLSDRSGLHTIVEAFAAFAETLAKIHELGISHRDIKPDNLFYYDGSWAVGDFGLATFKGKKAVSGGGRKIGPIYYLAPEMLNITEGTDESCADVFSLAKSLWVTATGQNYPLPGSYDITYDACAIGSYVSGERGVAELDRLIAAATAIDPSNRPTMKIVAEELRAWLAPKPEIVMPINFDVREHIAVIEQWQNSRARAAKSKAARDEAIQAVKKRLSTLLLGSFAELKDSIEKLLSINVVTSSPHRNGFMEIRVEIPVGENSQAFLILTLDLDCERFPTINLQGRLVLEWRTGAGLFNLKWNKFYDFIEGGADEAAKVEMLKSDMTEAMAKALTETLAFIISDPSHSEQHKSIRVTVQDDNQQMLSGASVRFVDREGIVLSTLTTADGLAEIDLPAPNDLVILVAHDSFQSEVITEIRPDNLVELCGGARSGSMVCGSSWVSVKGLQGELGFMHDEVDGGIHRVYVNLKGLSANSGEQGAIHLSMGKPVRLKDKTGRLVYITPRAVVGDNYLIDFKHVEDR